MPQQKTTRELHTTRGQAPQLPQKKNVQLAAAGELKNWDKAIGPRSVAAAERCRKQPEAKQKE